jgi:hypothetical protein
VNELRPVGDESDLWRFGLILCGELYLDYGTVMGRDMVPSDRLSQCFIQYGGRDTESIALVDGNDLVEYFADTQPCFGRDGDERCIVEELEFVTYLLYHLFVALLLFDFPFVLDYETGEPMFFY